METNVEAMKNPEILREVDPYLFKVCVGDNPRELFYFFGQFAENAETVARIIAERRGGKVLSKDDYILFMRKEKTPGDNVLLVCLLEAKNGELSTTAHFYLIPLRGACITRDLANLVQSTVCSHLDEELDCHQFPLRFGTCP
ncbi:hypothetical protein ACFLZC_00165 [Patescibacteria group bacterium]